ncbi:MAG: hypothetical protein WDM77_15240 [Steroidobacteraceae bacterium]
MTVTVGATEAIYSAIQAVVGAGDEVIVFDPGVRLLRSGHTPGGRTVRAYPTPAADLWL